MSKATDRFKQVIQDKLDEMAKEDPAFAESLKKKNKSIDECINYILSEVEKSGRHGFADDEIFGMAAHYYDEDEIKDPKKTTARVVVNHTVSLEEEEIERLKKQAREEVLAEERRRIKGLSRSRTAQPDQKESKNEQLSLIP